MPTVTAKDIAAKLNMSPAAVSLALNGKPGVSEATRALVLETAASMGYNKFIAPTLSADNKTLCFVRYTGEIVSIAEHTTFSAAILAGAEERAAEMGYSLQVRYLTERNLQDPHSLGMIRNADGIIFMGTDFTTSKFVELNRLFEVLGNIPVVVVDSPVLSSRTDCVINDSYEGAKSAVEYLISTGHKRIAYCRSKQRIKNFIEREGGAKAALHGAGRSVFGIIDVDISSEGAFQDFDAYLKTNPELPDGIFAENDVLAAAAVRALKKHGIDVPGDVSVMGFDDIPICEMLDPPMTTVHTFKEDLGRLAVEMVDRRLKRGEVPHLNPSLSYMKIVLSTKVVTRYSVKKR